MIKSGKRRTMIAILATLLVASMSYAQDSPAKVPCDSVEQRQFDFWVGDWDLSWEGGKGANRIAKILNECVVQETFDGAPMLRGLSVSTYDKANKLWRQTWVDDDGSYLDFTGGLVDGQMTLSRSAEREGKTFLQRMIWYNVSPDSLWSARRRWRKLEGPLEDPLRTQFRLRMVTLRFLIP